MEKGVVLDDPQVEHGQSYFIRPWKTLTCLLQTLNRGERDVAPWRSFPFLLISHLLSSLRFLLGEHSPMRQFTHTYLFFVLLGHTSVHPSIHPHSDVTSPPKSLDTLCRYCSHQVIHFVFVVEILDVIKCLSAVFAFERMSRPARFLGSFSILSTLRHHPLR
jgi:hypothetical protein